MLHLQASAIVGPLTVVYITVEILLTNYGIYDANIVVNRSSNDVPRAAFTIDNWFNLTINFYRRNYIEGLFLSSAVCVSPDHTMELLLKSVKGSPERRSISTDTFM
jgi:predicted DNA-binding helix-hairpin-helix protein